MSDNNDTQMVLEALIMAIKNKPKAQQVLLHSDQGSTYRSYRYLKLFKANNITQSMSRKGVMTMQRLKAFLTQSKQNLLIRKITKPEQKQKAVFLNILKCFIISLDGIQRLAISRLAILSSYFIK